MPIEFQFGGPEMSDPKEPAPDPEKESDLPDADPNLEEWGTRDLPGVDAR
jgi:hypothetical protein